LEEIRVGLSGAFVVLVGFGEQGKQGGRVDQRRQSS
jgi:hypothetical protein